MSTIQPLLFLAHGSPMNAIEVNDYTLKLRDLGKVLKRPKAIIVVSAHWMTDGTLVTHMPYPKTIHDFYGFPQELYSVQYPAKGDPELAERIRNLVDFPKIKLESENWGYDHGTWSVLCHLYPKAEIPVLQISLDMSKDPLYHFELGKKLSPLRKEDVLILGSGNIVHNLQAIEWDSNAQSYDWALQFDGWVKSHLESRNFDSLISEVRKLKIGRLAHPTWDHYFPLLYILGSSFPEDKMEFIYEGFQHASISMRSVMFYEK